MGKSKRRRGGFTLIEVLIAGTLTAFLLGSISMTLGQLGRAKSTCKERLDAHLRADRALSMIRADLASVMRSDDLFDTRLVVIGRDLSTPIGEMGRDELLVFNTRLRPIRSIHFNGEGTEYETQYRLMDQGNQVMLWQRRDAFPDRNPDAGGLLTPTVDNIVSLDFEMYDGDQWQDEWDSDFDGIPHAVRITVLATGARPEQSAYEGTTAILRTVVALDRVRPPADLFRLTEEELEELDARVLVEPGGTGESDAADESEATPAGGGGGNTGGGSGGGSGRDTGGDSGGREDQPRLRSGGGRR